MIGKHTRRHMLKLTAGGVVTIPVVQEELWTGVRDLMLRSDHVGVNHKAKATFYVATDGNDGWSGRLAEPNAGKTDGPLATLARAQSAVREEKARVGQGKPITVMVRGGKYYLEDTLVFGSEDSGSQDSPITYTAYPGEKPVLSGGRRVSGWKPYKGKILRAELPGSKGGKWKFRQLFFNGQRQIRARWPKYDPQNPLYGGWAFMEGPAEKGGTTTFKYKPGAFQHHWAKPTEGEVEFYQGTGQWRITVPIKAVNEKDRVIALTRPGYEYDWAPWYEIERILPGTPFYVTNLLEELDQPGEWSQDCEDGTLYFWPPNGNLGASDEVVVPALFYLVDIQGASWLRFSKFTFTETMDGDNTHHLYAEGAGAMGWQPGWRYCGDAVHMNNAEHCTIDRNHFDAVGGNAIYLEGYNARNVIQHNEISYSGANGICLLGTQTELKHPIFNVVSDNYIHHIGVLRQYVGGIFSGMSSENLFIHNRIEYVPHHAINLSNNPFGRNIVEHNQIRYACLQINDTGAINMWMEQPGKKDAERDGHIIRYNYIADTFNFQTTGEKLGNGGWSSGIYMDNYTSNSVVCSNIVVRCRNGLQLHAGKNNLIENNIFVDCAANLVLIDAVSNPKQFPYWKDMLGFYAGNCVWRNIFYQSDPAAFLYSLHTGLTERTLAWCDKNLFFQGAGGKYLVQDTRKLEEHAAMSVDALNRVEQQQHFNSLAQWQKLGYDNESLIADPLFVDASHENYNLKTDSPAFKLGFVPIDVKNIGPRADQEEE